MPKILVVDDSATMRKIVMKSVKNVIGDCEFVEAGDGEEGLEALTKNEVDLILSDINMPKMDGIQFVSRVRAQKTDLETAGFQNKRILKRVGNSIPIVMITSEGSLEQVQNALSAGANDYLKKPFTPDQLKEKIAPFLS